MSNEKIETNSPGEKIEDIAMIDSRVKGLAKQVFDEKNEEYKDISELVEKVFSLGIMDVMASNHEPQEVEEEFLVEDEFQYHAWQLNLCKHIEDIDAEWVDMKSMILRHGLEKISEKVITG